MHTSQDVCTLEMDDLVRSSKLRIERVIPQHSRHLFDLKKMYLKFYIVIRQLKSKFFTPRWKSNLYFRAIIGRDPKAFRANILSYLFAIPIVRVSNVPRVL